MKKRVISFHYTLKDKAGQVLDSSADQEPLSFLEGVGQIIPGLENAVKNFKIGEKQQVFVPSADGYGAHDKKLVVTVPRTKLPTQKVTVGDRFRGGSDAHAPVFTVTALTDAEATLDGNHPLAGQDLHFEVEVTAVRDATDEEASHGHAHGEGGHHH